MEADNPKSKNATCNIYDLNMKYYLIIFPDGHLNLSSAILHNTHMNLISPATLN